MDLNNIYAGADTFSSRNQIFRDYEKFPYGTFRNNKPTIKEPLFYTVSESENATNFDSRLCNICGRQKRTKLPLQIMTVSQKVFEADNDDFCYGHQTGDKFGYVNKMLVDDENIEWDVTKF